jgi:hypothetical protein
MRRLLVATPLLCAALDGGHMAALPPAPGPRGVRTTEEAAIEAQPVCIGSTMASAGTLGDVLYYRSVKLEDGGVAVGYYAFFSEERPWGNNWLTWSVVPAMAVDMVYSRALLVAPGIQRLLYGAGDVEGVGAVYDVEDSGALHLRYARADDAHEHPVTLSRERALALDPQRPTFYTEMWSHQLGGTSASSLSDLSYVRCYEGDAIRPLPASVARDFRLDRRAGPAHVERAVSGLAAR